MFIINPSYKFIESIIPVIQRTIKDTKPINAKYFNILATCISGTLFSFVYTDLITPPPTKTPPEKTIAK